MRSRAGIAALLVLMCAAARAAEEPARPVLLLSREVRPYLMAADAVEERLERPVTRLYLDDGLSRLEAALSSVPQKQRALIAVGPEAAETAARLDPVPPTLALLVVEPPPWPSGAPPAAAVLLRLPLDDQIRRLHAVFPRLSAVAVPLHQAGMSAWLSRALSGLRDDIPLRVFPVPVPEPPDWGRFLDQAAAQGARAILFLPHPGLASTAVIRHVTGQSLLRRMMPVGYNRSFLEAGAGAAFVVDAHGAGREGAALVLDPRFGKEPLVRIAPYRVVIKEAVARHVGIPWAEPLPDGVVME